ncbi:MAG: cardiolipin synthase [Ruminococcaceae bacterium]|nr:cardiolipin synthase [Oscillospiraceae bacterium]
MDKSKRGITRLVFSRIGIVTGLFLLQVFFLLFLFSAFENFLPQIWGGSIFLTATVVFYIVNCPMNSNSKITWLILILAFPVFGCLLFAYTKSDLGHRSLKERTEAVINNSPVKLEQEPNTLSNLEKLDKGIYNLARYIAKSTSYPVFCDTHVTYLESGEKKFEVLLKELEKAKEFIFLEYFIISEGKMWNDIYEILARKAKEGVEVRLMYDGTCEFKTVDSKFPKKLRRAGIQCKPFSPITPFVSTHYNYRDHRKIIVIDNKVAFTGGINLADEYINEKVRFGHWKDSAVMLKGKAVESFTLMFLQMWSLDGKEHNFDPYLKNSYPEKTGEGFVIPYGDCPTDGYKTGEHVYMDIINRATDYVHIMTPYLILDAEMENSIKFAAERGVDVSIIVPGIPDKKGAWALAKTHYSALISSGVNIYEYTPGFIHSKTFVSDSREAVVGTINLDYRSLYHHFECAAYFAFGESVMKVEEDFENTLKKCTKVTKESIKKEKLIIKIRGYILKVIAPLM